MASKHDKTEDPTPKRKRDARRKGQIARSQDLVMWAQMLAVSLLARGSVAGAGTALSEVMRRVGQLIVRPDIDKLVDLFGGGLLAVMLAVAPLCVGVLGVGMLGHFAQTGLLLSGEGLKPKIERLNPAKGLKKLFSLANGWELAKVLFRTSILALVALPPVMSIGQTLVGMGHPDLHTILELVGVEGMSMVRNTALAGLVLAGVDYGIQRRRIAKQMKMSKQEVKDETRMSDGDPNTKSAIRSRQLQMGRNRMMAAVAGATAVVVNPTHFAVAIKYEPGKSAPTVVAKGRGAVAMRIREEAERHKVPILSNVPLARALHASCELGQEIPVELYEAVARVLAVVMSLKATTTYGNAA